MRLRPLIRRPIDRQMLAASFGLAIGMMLIGWGLLSAETGTEESGLPEAIEVVTPGPDDQVLRQATIEADLIPGYTGRLVIDDREIPVIKLNGDPTLRPGDVVEADGVLGTRFDLGRNTLTYVPAQGAPIAQFAPGLHRVRVDYWRIDLGPDSARTFTWEFEVTG